MGEVAVGETDTACVPGWVRCGMAMAEVMFLSESVGASGKRENGGQIS